MWRSYSLRFLPNFVKIWHFVKRYKYGEIHTDSLVVRKVICHAAVTDILIVASVIPEIVTGGIRPSVYQAQCISQKYFALKRLIIIIALFHFARVCNFNDGRTVWRCLMISV